MLFFFCWQWKLFHFKRSERLKEEKGETIIPSVHQFLSNRLLCQCECTPVRTTAAANGHPLFSLLGKVEIVGISNFTLSCCRFFKGDSATVVLQRKRCRARNVQGAHKFMWWLFISKPLLFLNKTFFSIIVNKNESIFKIFCIYIHLVLGSN